MFSILNCTWILTLHLIKNETKQICETIRSTVQQTLHRDLREGGGSIRHNMLCRTLDLNLSEFFLRLIDYRVCWPVGWALLMLWRWWHWFKYPVFVSSMLHLVSWTTPYTEREGTWVRPVRLPLPGSLANILNTYNAVRVEQWIPDRAQIFLSFHNSHGIRVYINIKICQTIK